MNRRTALLTGAAVAATAAGAGAGWWRSRPGASGDGTDALWSLRFQTPAGSELALADYRGNPLLLNFWATWCPPCVSELPLIDAFEREHQAQGWRVVGLAVDKLEPVKDFLAKRPVGFGIGLAGLEGVDLSKRMGNTTGALPFSLVFNARGRLLARKLGVIEAAELSKWAGAAA